MYGSDFFKRATDAKSVWLQQSVSGFPSTAVSFASHWIWPASLIASNIRIALILRIASKTRPMGTTLHCLGEKHCIAAALCSLKPLLWLSQSSICKSRIYVLQCILYAYIWSTLPLVYMCIHIYMHNRHMRTCMCIKCMYNKHTWTIPFTLQQVQELQQDHGNSHTYRLHNHCLVTGHLDLVWYACCRSKSGLSRSQWST